MDLLHLYISPEHNFFGHHGMAPGANPMLEVEELDCVAGSGVRRDRFFNYKPDYKGQVTFFAYEVYEALRFRFDIKDKPPSVFRRNIITRGVDLNTLIGMEFAVGEVGFLGVEECKPCYWMDSAFCKGAEDALVGQGGLRARILASGILRATKSKNRVSPAGKVAVSVCPLLRD